MGEESTQLDLSSELDRLQAMKGDGEADGDVRVLVGSTVIDPDRVDAHCLVGTTVESDDASLRGTRWRHPLHDCHRPGVTFERDGRETDLPAVVEALGGPDLDTGYVLDRATGDYAAIRGRDGDEVSLSVIDAPPASPRTADESVVLSLSVLRTASRPGFTAGDRYRTFDTLGRSLDPTTI